MAVQTYAAIDVSVAQLFFTRFRKKDLSSHCLTWSTLLQSFPSKKKAVPQTGRSQSVSTTIKALLHSHGTGFLSSFRQDLLLHSKLHPKNGKLDWGNNSAGEKSLERSVEFGWPCKFPDCLLTLFRL